MEIFNNILTAFCTPNENLLNILLIPASFMENFLIFLLFASILNISTTTKQKIIYVCFSSIVGCINLSFLPNACNVILNYIVAIMLAYKVLKIPFLKSIFSIVISALIFNIVGALTLNPYVTLLNITSKQLTEIPIYRILYVLIIYIIVAIIALIIKLKDIKIVFLEDLDKKSKYIIFSNLFLGIFTLSLQTIVSVYYIDVLPLPITFFSFISLIAYFSISIYSITRMFKLILTTQKLQSAEAYNNTLHILHDNVRGFKHDFDNIVTTIGGYIRTNDMDGLKKYYVQLEDDCVKVNNLYLLNPDVINNDGIYNLLTKKYYEATSKDITMNLTFLLDLSTLKMKIYDFARILGILLDNSIEASSECNEKIINLSFRNDSRNSRQLIIIENTYNNKNIDTEKIFDKGVSGKSNHTGLGLWEVRKIVKKYNNINLYTTKNDKFFTQQLEIYY